MKFLLIIFQIIKEIYLDYQSIVKEPEYSTYEEGNYHYKINSYGELSDLSQYYELKEIYGTTNIYFKNSCEPPNYIYYDTEKKKVNLYLQQHLLVLLVLILK